MLEISPVRNFYCKYDSLGFSVKDYDTADTKFFVWNFDDGKLRGTYNSSILHIYQSAGKFQPAVYIQNSLNCKDTINVTAAIIINGPTANFSAAANSCTNSSVMFQDKSTASGSPITQWLWSYGDGTTSNKKISSNYQYAFPGTYNPYLKVTDANNCTDSLMDTINIFQSPTVDAGADTFACAGNALYIKCNRCLILYMAK